MFIRDLCQRNAADKAAGQCRGDIKVYIDGSRLLVVDVAVADATAASYPTKRPRWTSPTPRASHKGFVNRNSEDPDLSLPRLPSQSFVIEHHRIQEKKTKL